MSETREKLRPLKALKWAVLGVLLCAAAGLAGFLGGRYVQDHPEEPEISAVVLEARLLEISELASVTYQYTNMAQYENSGTFYGMTVPFTTKRFILTYDGVIKAGVDLSAAQVTVSGSAVTVALPPARILSHELDEDSVEVFDERTSIFNPFTVEDVTAFQAEQKALMEEKALQRGLLDQAREKAADSVQALLSAALPETVQLTVR